MDPKRVPTAHMTPDASVVTDESDAWDDGAAVSGASCQPVRSSTMASGCGTWSMIRRPTRTTPPVVVVTSVIAAGPRSDGTGNLAHRDPFHRSTTGLGTSACVTDPTAHTSRVPRATRPVRIASPEPRSGVGTTLHRVPFQCSTRGRYERPATCHPTAHASSGAVTATSFKAFGPVPTFGLPTRSHVEPSHRSVSVR